MAEAYRNRFPPSTHFPDAPVITADCCGLLRIAAKPIPAPPANCEEIRVTENNKTKGTNMGKIRRTYGALVQVLLLIALVALVALVASMAVSSAVAADENASYQKQEFNFDTFAVVRSADLDEHRLGAGIGGTLFLSRNLGVNVSAWSYDRRERVIDEGSASLVYRIPNGPSAISFFGGGGYDFERDAKTMHVGMGVEHRFTPHFAIFAEARFEKRLSDGENAGGGRAGIRLAAF